MVSTTTRTSTGKRFSRPGVEYEVEVSSEAVESEIEQLIRVVDDVAEMPKALRAAAEVRRVEGDT